MKHIDEIEMEQYLDGNVSLVRRGLISMHLRKCTLCAERLEALRKEREELLNIGQTMVRLVHARETVTQSGFYNSEKVSSGDDE